MDHTVHSRSLKVEPIGDLLFSRLNHRPLASGLRLKGHWFTRLGFPPGRRVIVESVGQGHLVIKLQKIEGGA